MLTDSNISSVLLPIGFDGGGDGGTGASEGDPSGSGEPTGGAPNDGGSGGTQTGDGGNAFTDRDAALAEMRSAQSARDRLRAEIAQLEARRSEANSGGGSGDEDGDRPLTRAELLETLAERDRLASHRETMAGAVPALRDRFEHADGDLFDRASEFDSPEALAAAAEASHQRVASIVETAVARERERVLNEVAEKYGVRLTPPVDPEGETPSGDPTIEQIQAMSLGEMSEFEEANPGVIDRVLRSAT